MAFVPAGRNDALRFHAEEGSTKMADEVGPLRAETDVLRGALPDRLTEAALTYAELTRASVPWLTGDVDVPLAQLKDLADWAAAMQVACGAVVTEARRVYRDTTRRRAAA